MKKILFIFFITVVLFAQEKKFQINIGFNRSWLIYDDVEILNRSDFIPKFNLSLNYNFYQIGSFRITIGLRYYNLGKSLTINVNSIDKESVKINHYLLSLPLQLKYRIEILKINLLLNSEGSYLFKSTFNYDRTFDNYNEKRGITGEMNRFLFSAGAGLEYNFMVNKELFGLGFILNYMITEIPQKKTFRNPLGEEYNWISYKAKEISFFISYNF
ncbi:MAG: hypothetical protein QHH13_07735 [Melioribacter sp.]|uniref:outer membrane beta-barrel protein n=1 Tax=Rosettibacter primus TaxID=3111523 RepID=UPI00247C37E4|nr:hypothetical protein [Melioribacter sp.]